MSFATALEKATNESQQTEEWQAIMDFSDKVSAADEAGRNEAIQALTRRLNHANPQVQLHTITVLTSCVKNCGRPFQTTLCNSRDLLSDIKKIVNSIKSDVAVVGKLKELLLAMQKEFRDSQQRTITGVINSLKDSGIAFDDGLPARSASAAPAPSSSSSSSAREDAELQRALAESLKLAESKPPQAKGIGKARALYDFDAREENELAVRVGEVVTLLDTSDSNWWRGRNAAGEEGCFPATFMTTDTATDSATPTSAAAASAGATPVPSRPQSQEINVALLDQLMKSIAQITPGQQPPAQLDELMAAHNAMKPTVKSRVNACSERKRALEDACGRFQQTMARYDALMQAPLPQPPAPVQAYYAAPTQGYAPQPLADPRLAASSYGAPQYATAPAHPPPHPSQYSSPAPAYGSPSPAPHPYAPTHAHSPSPAAGMHAQGVYSPQPPPQPSAYAAPPPGPMYANAQQQQMQSWQYNAVPRN